MFNSTSLNKLSSNTLILNNESVISQYQVVHKLCNYLEITIEACNILWQNKTLNSVILLSYSLQLMLQETKKWKSLLCPKFVRELKHFYTCIGNLDTNKKSIRNLDNHAKLKIHLKEKSREKKLKELNKNRKFYVQMTRIEIKRIKATLYNQ